MRRTVPFLTLAVLVAAAVAAAGDLAVETYTLPNGLTVTLHEDHSQPMVVVNTWFGVGAKDEPAGRTGFAHLFEHLMFMGTARVPGNSFDVIMETGGGANNASTGVDRTNYFSWGPSSLLPTLLWLDADRLEGLGKAMTTEKVELQKSVVRNERRQSYENRPYGIAGEIIPAALYPEGHPYHHPVIGSHEDLAAATVDDVKSFFATYYVPGNASLVVAGDFDPEVAKRLVAATFGAVPAQPLPSPIPAPPARLDREVRRMATDSVSFPRLYLVWHSPAAFAPGDAELDLLASILADGDSGRLQRRLVVDERLAQDVSVFQYSKVLGSEFHIEATASAGSDLERIKHAVLEELAVLQETGPTAAELERARAATESSFLRRRESLLARADMLNALRRAYGEADSFDRELHRRLAPTADDIRATARSVFGPGRLDLRILPAGATVAGADLDRRPESLPDRSVTLPTAERFTLANGMPVVVVSRPGSGLFSGALVADGGERLFPGDQAGLCALTATMLTAGAGERDASAFADAAAALGADISASSSWHDLTVRVSGLTSRLDPTLDLFADALLRPRLEDADFEREKALALEAISQRPERPNELAAVVSRALLYGHDDPRGRAPAGWQATVEPLTVADVRGALPRLVDPSRATLVFAGDFTGKEIAAALDARLGAWTPAGDEPPAAPAAVTATPGRIVLVDRPDAPQTVIYVARPVPAPDDDARPVRHCLNTILGGSFTSRLMQNIREKHGYSYGARSSLVQDGSEHLLTARSAVQTAVTAAALGEFRNEFAALASGDVTPDELAKAVRTVRFDLETAGATTSSQAAMLVGLTSDGRPLDATATELAGLSAVALPALNDEARSGLYAWDGLLVVLVGDRAEVLGQLESAGFPAPEIVDAEGRPVTP